MRLNDPAGRKAGKHKIKKRVIKNVVAGVGFLFGATNVINVEQAILEVIKGMRDVYSDGKGARRVEDGNFDVFKRNKRGKVVSRVARVL